MPGRDGERSGTGVSLQRHLKAAFTERLGYKAAAVFFAVVLWLVVSAEEPSEELVPVRLEASFDTGRVLTSPRPIVRALVAGRARELLKLYENRPIVRRTVTDDAPDSVAIDLRPADVYIPPDIDAVVRDVKNLSYATLVVPLTKAIQELKAANDNLVKSNQQLSNKLDAQARDIEELRKALNVR